MFFWGGDFFKLSSATLSGIQCCTPKCSWSAVGIVSVLIFFGKCKRCACTVVPLDCHREELIRVRTPLVPLELGSVEAS